eukprot:15459504-Alexandrium_andersonii.AAC.1
MPVRGHRSITHSSGTSGSSFEVVSGVVEFQLRAPKACLACSIHASGPQNRNGRSELLLRSIDTR